MRRLAAQYQWPARTVGLCALLIDCAAYAAATDPMPSESPAENGPAPPAAVTQVSTSAAGSARPDIVRLKNGGLVRGTIEQILPGDSVVVLTSLGEVKRFAWNEVAYAGPAVDIAASGASGVQANHPIAQDPARSDASVVGSERSMHPMKVTGIIVGSIGAVVATTALIARSLRSSNARELESLCGADRDCTDDKPNALSVDELARARTLSAELDSTTALWNVTLVGGGLALVTGVVLFLAAPDSSKRTAATWHFVPAAPKTDIGGVSLVANF